MNLFKKIESVEVNNYNLLTQMMELSKANVSIDTHLGVFSLLYNTMCSFNTGRQTGKTTAALRYTNENAENTILVVHNRETLKNITRPRGYPIRNIFPASDFINKKLPDNLRGFKYDELSIIFDECNSNQIHDTLDTLISYNILTLENTSGIVKIGE